MNHLNLCEQILELELINTNLNQKDCHLISGAPMFSSLKVLNLSCNPLEKLGLCNLLKNSMLRNLENLIMFNCQLESQKILQKEDLKKLTHLISLKSLNLSFNPGMMNKMESELIECLFNPSLRELLVIDSGFSDSKIAHKVVHRTENLTNLDISDNQIDLSDALMQL